MKPFRALISSYAAQKKNAHVFAIFPAGRRRARRTSERRARATVRCNLREWRSSHSQGSKREGQDGEAYRHRKLCCYAPVEVYLSDTKERKVLRGPECRVAAPPPPYNSELEAYCVSRQPVDTSENSYGNTPSFDLISIMPSLIFGADMNCRQHRRPTHWIHSSPPSIPSNRTGGPKRGSAMRSYVRMSPAPMSSRSMRGQGNQSFILSVDAKWEDTVPFSSSSLTHSNRASSRGWLAAGNSLQWDTIKVSTPILR